jgi:hypothetical protein
MIFHLLDDRLRNPPSAGGAREPGCGVLIGVRMTIVGPPLNAPAVKTALRKPDKRYSAEAIESTFWVDAGPAHGTERSPLTQTALPWRRMGRLECSELVNPVKLISCELGKAAEVAVSAAIVTALRKPIPRKACSAAISAA